VQGSPARSCAAAGPASATPRRGVGRVAAVAAIVSTTCGAVRCTARCAMASYWCCASCHVVDDIGYHRHYQALAQSDFALSADDVVSNQIR